VAAALSGVVAWSLASAVRPPPDPTTTVVTATHDLLPGAALTADDLSLSQRPSDSVPDDVATTTGQLVGRLLVTPVHAGETVRARDVLDSPLLRELGPGVVATSVRLADASTAALVAPGDRVDVVAAVAGDGNGNGDPTASVVASGVRVLAVASRATTDTGGIFGGSGTVTGSDGLVVIVAATSTQALELARAGLRGRLSFVFRAR
jgi:pilus assembly protein CpaB